MGEVFVVDDKSQAKRFDLKVDDRESDLIATTAKELFDYHKMNQAFSGMEPDQVLVQISAITSRLTYLRACLMDSGGQRAQKIRTTNLEPLMNNLELQFRIASRRLSSYQFDFEVTRGAPS